MIREHNIEVKKSGQGVFWDERVTDNDESVSRKHIRVSKERKTMANEEAIINS